jgi:hypothetical protein
MELVDLAEKRDEEYKFDAGIADKLRDARAFGTA